MEIEKINIFSSRIEKQYQFYCNRLMLNCIEKNDRFFSVKAGSSLLQIQKSTTTTRSCYHLAFNIEPSLFHESVAFVQQKDISLLESENKILIDFPDWNARSIYFRDADGNILEFIARYNLPHHQYARVFVPNDIISISEIGIPVKDIGEFLAIMKSNTATEIWKSYGQTFYAVGDEKGLLIIVPEKHKWFPTNIEATQRPAEIYFKQAGKDFSYENLKFHFISPG